jgi:hypothetical protein
LDPNTPQIRPSHVAILVPSARKAADYLRKFDFEIAKEDEFPGEGTKEIYVEGEKANSLLLMEAIGPGAYQRAMQKRGPGIHHLAVDVLNIEDYLLSLTGSGWLLHPSSIQTIKQSKTAYLARPGFPALIEVQQREKLSEGSLFVDKISLCINPQLLRLAKSVGLQDVLKVAEKDTMLSLGGTPVCLSDLF